MAISPFSGNLGLNASVKGLKPEATSAPGAAPPPAAPAPDSSQVTTPTRDANAVPPDLNTIQVPEATNVDLDGQMFAGNASNQSTQGGGGGRPRRA